MKEQKGNRDGFTLVELLVVIGIIALLIAILMPALSRARKQALAVSSGSNQRQLVYGVLAYANDWKERLASKVGGHNAAHMWIDARLPIIGFDTLTVYRPTTDLTYGCVVDPGHDSPCPPMEPAHVGGLAYVMRDYMKNDWDIIYNPDGWVQRERLIVRDFFGPPLVIGYSYMPHRQPGNGVHTIGGTMYAGNDRAKLVAKTASDKPGLLVWVDFAWRSLYPELNRFMANHTFTSDKPMFGHWIPVGSVLREAELAELPVLDLYDPEAQPMGMNRARIDARVQWKPFQDFDLNAFVGLHGPPAEEHTWAHMW